MARDLFQKLDLNGSGSINAQELHATLQQQWTQSFGEHEDKISSAKPELDTALLTRAVDNLIALMDVDHDGTISLEEYAPTLSLSLSLSLSLTKLALPRVLALLHCHATDGWTGCYRYRLMRTIRNIPADDLRHWSTQEEIAAEKDLEEGVEISAAKMTPEPEPEPDPEPESDPELLPEPQP